VTEQTPEDLEGYADHSDGGQEAADASGQNQAAVAGEPEGSKVPVETVSGTADAGQGNTPQAGGDTSQGAAPDTTAEEAGQTENLGNHEAAEDVLGTAVEDSDFLQLIYDSSEVDYMSYIPEMKSDSELNNALDINNPDLEIDARAAILFDAATKEVLYYKNAVEPVFPASTAKLLTSLVTLDWCSEDEQITVGNEVSLIAVDATRAYLKAGEVLTLRNLLEGMLLPSGNDAAFAAAAYVGRKSLQDKNASAQAAIKEFIRLMNLKASELGAKNSCFKTPDGYDALGQYTTAYDMGRIGLAAINNDIIKSITKKSRSRNVFISGEDVTWYNTNNLINKDSGSYYSNAIGLKTGTSSMAGKCLIAAGRKDGRTVVCAVMDSSASGRWEDAEKLLKYGLK
jgi:D-alanyl-D-alanine carboxypeptidase (penicillin-binding protein 5/6)